MRSPSFRALVWAGILSTTALSVPGRAGAQSAEGIKVHGYWVVEVRDAAGKLQERRAFENALVNGGKKVLVALLANRHSLNSWHVALVSSTNDVGPCGITGCVIFEPSALITSPFKNLTVTPAPNGLEFSLQGHLVASADFDVAKVWANVEVPAEPDVGFRFTEATLSPAIPVRANQTISVIVTYSFQ